MKLPKFSQTFLIIIIAEIFTSILVILYFNYSIPTVSQVPIFPTPTSTEWLTFKNDQFEFQYPADMEVNADPKTLFLFYQSDPCLTISILEPRYKKIESKNFTFAGKKAIQFIVEDIDVGKTITVIQILNPEPLFITSYCPIYDSKILSTFKFTNQKYTCPTSEWVNCMPGPGAPKPQCQPEFIKWATQNCPNFKGAAL